MLENKKILVTGADGFIGSHLVQALRRSNAQVRALSYYNSFNHIGWLKTIEDSDNIEILAGDIRDPHLCRKITEDIDIVFHLAALIAIPYSYQAPESYLQTNVLGTANLCQAALDHSVERFLHVSSSEVYGTAQYVPIDEHHPLQPQSPYSASKIGGETLALSFFYSFDLPVTILRPFNTYGPRQSTRAIIPSLIEQLMQGKTEISAGSLTPTRDFSYVDDMCESFIELALAEKAIGEIVNIGTGTEISIENLALEIGKIFGKPIEFVLDPKRIRPSRSEVQRLCCDATKFRQLTNFQFSYSLQEGLKRTIDWFIKYRNAPNLDMLCVEQQLF